MEMDFRDGTLLATLLEKLSFKPIRTKKGPMMRLHKVENVSNCFRVMTEAGIKLVGIGAEDIVDGNELLLLGMLWTIIRTPWGEDSPYSYDKAALLEWVVNKIKGRVSSLPTNFDSDWKTGHCLAALVAASRPAWNATIHKLYPQRFQIIVKTIFLMRTVDPMRQPLHPECDWWKIPIELVFNIITHLATLSVVYPEDSALEIVKQATGEAESLMQIPQLVDPEDIIKLSDPQYMMTYVTMFQDYEMKSLQ